MAWSKLWANISDGLIERGIYFWPSAAFRASTDLTVWLAQSFIAPSAKRLGDQATLGARRRPAAHVVRGNALG